MLLTCGLISLRHTVASIDAVSVAALKEAGAILLCTTNVAELCRWWETENRLYGTTNNPYHSNYGSGGSGEVRNKPYHFNHGSIGSGDVRNNSYCQG